MASTLGMAILGLLAREPLTGYELSRTLKGAIRYFWQAGHSQVYPELARLEEEGFVTHERIPQQGKPDQKRFSVTAPGMSALQNWLVGPLEPTPKRSEIALRAYCVAQADRNAAKAFFEEKGRQHRERLVAFEGAKGELEAIPPHLLNDPQGLAFANYAVLMRGLAFEEAGAKWCEWMSERLDAKSGINSSR